MQRKILEQGQFLPIFVHASDLEGLKFKDIKGFISHPVELLELELPKAQVTAFLKKHFNKVKLLVDGLDQIKGAGTDYGDLLDKLLLLGNVIVASRPFAVISHEETADVKFLRLKPFDTKAQKQFFGKHYNRACDVCESRRELMGIPMLAFMVRTLIEKKQDKDIRTRTDIYGHFINHILYTDIGYKHDKLRSDTDVDTRVRLTLAEISYEALAKGHIQKIPVEFCEKYTDNHKTSIERLLKHGLVKLIVDQSQRFAKFIYFTHQSFQEYLAAEWASRSEELLSRILNEMWNPKWKEVIKFLAGLKGEPFVERIYSPGCKDNCIHSRLFLAAECCGEISTICDLEERIFDDIRNLVSDEAFRNKCFTALSNLKLNMAIDFLITSLVGDASDDERCDIDENPFPDIYLNKKRASSKHLQMAGQTHLNSEDSE